MALRLVMMGTGGFALPTFKSLLQSDHCVVGLFTQPDRSGRGHHHHANPLKDDAIEHGIPVFQPDRVNAPEALADLRALNADVFVVAAYGQILSDALLSIPRLGAINVHASLLPKYRGAAPIQYAVLNGESVTGVTIFRIEPKLDSGPILAMAKTPIGPNETAGDLEDRLAVMSIELVGNVLRDMEAGTARGTMQDAAQATRAPRIRKEFGLIDWSKTAAEIDWHVRAMQPWPTAYSYLARTGDQPLRLIVLEVQSADASSPDAQPGTILDTMGGRIIVQTGTGSLEVVRLRPEGKKTMTADEFLRGHAIRPGMRFESRQLQG